MVFTRFKEGYFWKKIGSQKWPKFAKKGMLTYTDQISKIAGRSRVPYGSGTRDLTRALAEVFFGFRGLIFSQNWSAFHLSKRQVSSSNRLKVMVYWSLPSFLGKKQVFFAIGVRRDPPVVHRQFVAKTDAWCHKTVSLGFMVFKMTRNYKKWNIISRCTI